MMSQTYGLKKNKTKKSPHTTHPTMQELILRHVKFSEVASSNIMPLLSLNCLSLYKTNLKAINVKLIIRGFCYFLLFC